MAKRASNYECLVKGRFGLGGAGSLWLAPDHLLLVANTSAVETYRRWYFKDIQALIARHSASRLVWNICMGLVLLVVAAVAAICFDKAGSDTGADRQVLIGFGIFFSILATGCLIVLLVNTAMGPSCVVHIQTPFAVDKLALPGRMRSFQKIAARLQPLIEASQAQPQRETTTTSLAPTESPQVE